MGTGVRVTFYICKHIIYLYIYTYVLCIYIIISFYTCTCTCTYHIYLPGTQITLVLIEKGLVLGDWPSKIEVIGVPGIYIYMCVCVCLCVFVHLHICMICFHYQSSDQSCGSGRFWIYRELGRHAFKKYRPWDYSGRLTAGLTWDFSGTPGWFRGNLSTSKHHGASGSIRENVGGGFSTKKRCEIQPQEIFHTSTWWLNIDIQPLRFEKYRDGFTPRKCSHFWKMDWAFSESPELHSYWEVWMGSTDEGGRGTSWVPVP